MVNIIQQFRQGPNATGDQPQELGSIVVLVALALTALLGFCAIVTDVGILYAKKVQLQNSVNAAALAGVQELPNNLSQAVLKAKAYASQNGVPAATVTVGTSNASIMVKTSQQVPTYFARIWGITEKQISVSAKAMIIPPTGMKGAVPLSILSENVLANGASYVLKFGAGDGDSGWYGGLDLRNTSSSGELFRSDLLAGYPGELSVGQSVNIMSGLKSGPTGQAICDRIIPGSTNTFDEHDRNAPEIMYIPIVTPNGTTSVKIVGFAAFFIDKVEGNGGKSIVTGRFLHQLASKATNNSSLSDLLKIESDTEKGIIISNNYGVYTSKLVKE